MAAKHLFLSKVFSKKPKSIIQKGDFENTSATLFNFSCCLSFLTRGVCMRLDTPYGTAVESLPQLFEYEVLHLRAHIAGDAAVDVQVECDGDGSPRRFTRCRGEQFFKCRTVAGKIDGFGEHREHRLSVLFECAGGKHERVGEGGVFRTARSFLRFRLFGNVCRGFVRAEDHVHTSFVSKRGGYYSFGDRVHSLFRRRGVVFFAVRGCVQWSSSSCFRQYDARSILGVAERGVFSSARYFSAVCMCVLFGCFVFAIVAFAAKRAFFRFSPVKIPQIFSFC